MRSRRDRRQTARVAARLQSATPTLLTVMEKRFPRWLRHDLPNPVPTGIARQ
jgi:hypothetical protein